MYRWYSRDITIEHKIKIVLFEIEIHNDTVISDCNFIDVPNMNERSQSNTCDVTQFRVKQLAWSEFSRLCYIVYKYLECGALFDTDVAHYHENKKFKKG